MGGGGCWGLGGWWRAVGFGGESRGEGPNA